MEPQNPASFNDSKKKTKKPWTSLLQHEATEINAPPSGQIPTPEKPAQLPLRACRRNLTFSVSDVRKVALGLRRGCHESADQQALARSDDGVDMPSRACSDSIHKSLGDKQIVKLPEKYEMLVDFFSSLESSIRLLLLKRRMTTFSNINASIQHLTGRRFTYGHLAQMKHILPEAISIKRVLLRDETTCCMKPELQVSLHVDAVECKLDRKGESTYTALRKLFRSRVLDYAREHPEEDDIPEGTLPPPFGGQAELSISTESNESSLAMHIKSSTGAHSLQQMPTISHIPPSFQRRFSLRPPLADSLRTLTSLNEVAASDHSFSLTSTSPFKCPSKPTMHKKSLFSSPDLKPLSSNHPKYEEDSVKLMNDPLKESKASESTPAKDSTPAWPMTITPQLQTPKRSRQPTLHDTTQKEVMKRATRTKLFPTPRKTEKVDGTKHGSVGFTNDDVLDFLPESLLQDIRDKEKHEIEERNSGAAGARLRKKMVSCLPKLLDSILLIFQSGNRSVITKQELVHKILSSHINAVDRIEVEEQLDLLEELAPDWISGKTATTGEFLYRLNKFSSPVEIRQRLSIAK